MNDNYYEELIRMEAEQLAMDEFGVMYCDLLPQQRLRLRELVIDRLGIWDAPAEPSSRAA
jgi:hypothetical protein